MTEPTPIDSLGLDSSDPPKTSSRLELQPSLSDLVWQANPLSTARYQLSETEQKLLLYCIAMVGAKDSEFRTYRVNVAAYAEACGINTTVIYGQLKEAAKTIRDTPVMIPKHTSKDGKTVELYTSWFVEVECGTGYIDVMFAHSLRPYLLGVRSEFFKYELAIPLHLAGEYAIRLYQLCRRWKFRGSSGKIAVSELRMMLGLTVLDGKGNPVRERLEKYGDAKKWAILPALAEISRASDILVTMKEYKRPKTKLVESVEFLIRPNPAYQPDVSLPKLLPGAKVAALVDAAVEAMRQTLLTEFEFSPEQTRKVLGQHPLAYIEEKATIVRSEPRDNAGKSLSAAIRDDWRPGKKIEKKRPVKKATPAPVEPAKPALTPEEEAARAASVKETMAAFKAARKGGGPKVDPATPDGSAEVQGTPTANSIPWKAPDVETARNYRERMQRDLAEARRSKNPVHIAHFEEQLVQAEAELARFQGNSSTVAAEAELF